MNVTFETLPDELLELVFESLAAAVPDEGWPDFAFSIEWHFRKWLEPTLLNLCLTSKRLHSVGQRFLPHVKSIKRYWNEDIGDWRKWAGYCAYVGSGIFYAYAKHWEREHFHFWTPRLSEMTHLVVKLDTRANAEHFGSVLVHFVNLVHLKLVIWSKETHVRNYALHHAFFTAAGGTSSPKPASIPSFHYCAGGVDDFLSLILPFIDHFRIERVQLECDGQSRQGLNHATLSSLKDLALKYLQYEQGFAVPRALRRAPNLERLWVLTSSPDKPNMWLEMPPSLSAIVVYELNSFLHLHDTMLRTGELPKLRYVDCRRLVVDLAKIVHPTVITLEDVLCVAKEMDQLLQVRGGYLQPRNWVEKLEASARANELQGNVDDQYLDML